jgi:hypothetical protein
MYPRRSSALFFHGRRFIKFAIVFTGTLSGSWALALTLRKIPVVARMI